MKIFDIGASAMSDLKADIEKVNSLKEVWWEAHNGLQARMATMAGVELGSGSIKVVDHYLVLSNSLFPSLDV